MMKSYNGSVEVNHNTNLSYIPDSSYMILIIGGLDQENIMCYLM